MRKKTTFWLTAIFVSIPVLFSSPSSLFAQVCDTVAVTRARTEIQRDPQSLAVLADSPNRRSKCAVYTDMNEAGYFKIFVDTRNNLDQPNESYFMTVKYSDGTWASLCDPNLGSWKVVPDTLVSDTTGLRYAGTFYFQNGVNQIILNHYAIIAEDHPDFWIGPSDSASIINGSANSVHVTQIVLEKVVLDGYDLSVTYSAKTDTSLPINGNTEQVVPVGGNYSYQLNLEGLGTQIINDVKLWMVPPDSVHLTNFNIQPTGAHSDTLYWIFNEVGAGQKISITYNAKVAAALPATPFLLFSECAVGAGCESNTTNNAAEATVYAINPENYFATDISLTQTVQTDTSLEINGNLEPVVPAGKNYSGQIKVENKGPKIAGDLILWLVPPDSVNLINFNIPPDYSSGDTLFWRFSGMTPGQQIDITFQADVSPHLPNTPFPLLLESHVDYPHDTDTGNNSAEDTVYAIDPLTVWGTDISLTQTVRTDSSMEISGSEEQIVPVGGQFDYELHVRNQGPNPADRVILWVISPDTVQLHNFNIPPSRISGDTLFWVFDNLPLGQQIDITFQADVSHNLYNVPFRLPIESGIDYPYDTNPNNDAADDTVYVVDAGYFATTGCDTVYADPDTTRIQRDPNQLVVIADVIERRSRCAVHVGTNEPGYYQIMVNTWNDPDQRNESYFMTVLHPDGKNAPLCDPNLGEWKVVPDISGSDPTGLQDAGTFYLQAGINKIVLNHYAIIAEQYPDFWIGPSDSTSLMATPQSVHVIQIVLIKITDGYDVALTYAAQTDTSIEISGNMEQAVLFGNSYSYHLNINNQGNLSANNVRLWAKIPSQVQLSNFNIQPDNTNNDTLFWNFPELTSAQQIDISFNADVPQSLPTSPFQLLSQSSVDARCDANKNNNAANVTVYAIVDSCSLFQPGTPQIETDQTLIEVGDSVTVRVSLPDRVLSWDLWVRYVDGTIDSSFADDYITTSPLTANQWLTIEPSFSNTLLITSAEHENVIFELRTVDKCNNARVVQTSVTIKSSNDCLLDRNVFEPGSAAALGILFKLSSNRTAKLDLYDVTGYHVTKITEGPFNAGWNKYPWNGLTTDGQPVGSGLYIVTIRSGNFYCWKKVIIAR